MEAKHSGLYLSDLMYIEDGNPDEIEGGLINFEKRRLKAEVVRELYRFQTSPYCLQVRPISLLTIMVLTVCNQEVPVMQYFFRRLEYLDEGELYNRSCRVEPPTSRRYSTPPAKG